MLIYKCPKCIYNESVDFVPGEMVWILRNKQPILVMCLEEDFPIQTFLHGSEVITIMSNRTVSITSNIPETKFFKTKEDCEVWIASKDEEFAREKAAAFAKIALIPKDK